MAMRGAKVFVTKGSFPALAAPEIGRCEGFWVATEEESPLRGEFNC